MKTDKANEIYGQCVRLHKNENIESTHCVFIVPLMQGDFCVILQTKYYEGCTPYFSLNSYY